jgi:branched-subunit amino acid aminotransferase/4-amino-4-deoxychorismate lyase
MSAAGRIQLNGEPANADDLRHLVANNFGHFTSMRVVDSCVRGLDFHIERLVRSTHALFGSELDAARLRGFLRAAIDGDVGSLSLRVNVFSRAYDRINPSKPVPADVLVMVNRANEPSEIPLRVKSFAYERDAPHVKHVGTFPLFHYRRLAQQAGFDDALFVDRSGNISEGSVWNVGFFDGDSVVWPDAPQLEGVSKQLLIAGLRRNGIGCESRSIPRAALGRLRAAFFTNSAQAVRPIAQIDGIDVPLDADCYALLNACYDSNPLQRI